MATFDKSLATALKISCACAAFTAASAAWAQDGGKPPAPAPRNIQEPALAATPDAAGQDDIIVEALKQGESVLKTAATVKVADDAALTAANVTSARDLGGLVPGFTFMQGTAGGSASFRGLGSNSSDPAIESSVGAFNDGVYLGHVRDFTTPLYDIKQIEFIAGTQSTVLGKNTSLGAVSITSRYPGRTFAFDGSATYTSAIDGVVGRAAADIPLSKTFAVRLSGFYDNERGFTRNMFIGRNEQQLRDLSGRIVVDGDIGSGSRLTLIYQHDRRRADGQYLELLSDPDGLAAVFAGIIGQPAFDGTANDRTLNGSKRLIPGAPAAPLPFDNQDSNRATGIFKTEFGNGMSLTAQTAYVKWTSARRLDQDYTQFLLLDQIDNERNEIFSQELRLNSRQGDRFSYVLGAFYYYNNYKLHRQIASDLGEDLDAFSAIRTNSFSLFASGRYKVTGRFAVLAGIRETWEGKTPSYDVSGTLAAPIAPVTLAKNSSAQTDYNGGIEYAVNRDVLLYVTYARGSKGGGFQSVPDSTVLAGYGPEVARSWEAGAKFDLRRFGSIQFAAFDTRLSNFQAARLVTVPGFPLPLNQITNVDARTTGAEVNVRIKPTSRLTLTGGLTYADARFTQGLLSEVAPGIFRPEITDGMRLPRAPRWSGDIAIDYRAPLTRSLELSTNARLQYASEADLQFNVSNPDAPKADEHAILNLEVRLGNPKTGWSVAVIGNNLTNVRYTTFTSDWLLSGFINPAASPAYYGTRNRPRTVSAQLALKF